MRRLLNRCHHLLFGDQADRNTDPKRRSAIVSELDQQLDDWRRLLPPAFHFSVDMKPVQSQQGAFLRQRFLTCRALIYRPYLMDVLIDHASNRPSGHQKIEGARRCLQGCILHIVNLRPFDQTVLVDMWICALSMAGTMMIILAAFSTASLSNELSENLLSVGPHLTSLLTRWANVHGEGESPSIAQAIQWIVIVDSLLQRGHQPANTHLGTPG